MAYQPIIAPVNRPVMALETGLWTDSDDAALDALLSGASDDPDVDIPDSGVLNGRIVA